MKLPQWKLPLPKTVLLAVAAGVVLVLLLLGSRRRTREGFQSQSPTDTSLVPAINLTGKAIEVTPQACEIMMGMLDGLTKQLDDARVRDNTVAFKALDKSIAVVRQQLDEMKCAELAAPKTTV